MSQSPEEKKILERFRHAREKRQLKDAVWTELDKFDRGEQWDSANLPPWIPKPVTNMVHLVKTTKRAALAMENPTGKLRPLTPADHEPIEKLQNVYEYEWERMKARKAVRDCIETAKLLGTAITQVYWEENTGVKGGTGGLYEGEVRVRQVDPSIFFPDPTAFTIEDCRFIHLVERKSVAWLKKHPVFGPKMREVETRQVADAERGEIYQRDSSASGKKGIIDFHTHYEKEAQPEGGFKFKVTYLAGDKIVHTVDNLRPNRYPFSVLYDYPQRQDFWGKSTCELVLDNQKLLNKVEGIIAMIGTHLQNPQQVVSKQSGINPKEAAKYSTAPGYTFVANGDITRAIIWKQPPQIPQALFNLAEQAKENIREITGITDAYMGNAPGSVQTSSGVNSLIERATMRDRDQMYEVELFIEDLTRNILSFITEFYTTERYARVIGEDGMTEEFMAYTGEQYQGVEFDFFIDVSAKAPITRQRLIEEADKLLNIQGQYQYEPSLITPEEYVRKSQFADKDKILKRMEFDKMNSKVEMMTQVAAMMHEGMMNGVPQEEIQQMAQQMLQQFEDQRKGIGSANTGAMQQRQAGAGGMV